MKDFGIHAIVVSYVKVFNGESLKVFSQNKISESLIDSVANNPEFDSQRVEIVTTGESHFTFSGKIFGPIPTFHEILSVDSYEKSIGESMAADSFKFHAAVRLSVAYPFEEFQDFIQDAKDEGYENPNLFSWMEYCIADASETLAELMADRFTLRDELTVRGV